MESGQEKGSVEGIESLIEGGHDEDQADYRQNPSWSSIQHPMIGMDPSTSDPTSRRLFALTQRVMYDSAAV